MSLTLVEESLVLATYFRGGRQDDCAWTSNTDQILTLSLFYTGDISSVDCAGRFSKRPYIQNLYDDDGKLIGEIKARYAILIDLLKQHSELIVGGGDFETPAYPTYTACRLTYEGLRLSASLVKSFPRKPNFPNWPDKRTMPDVG